MERHPRRDRDIALRVQTTSVAYAARSGSQAERDAYGMFTKAPLAKIMNRAGACGPRASAARNRPTAMQRPARTARPAASSAPRSAPTICSRRARSRASRWPAAAPTFRRQWRQRPLRSVPGRRLSFVTPTGAAYVSAALAYGWQDITTDRTVTIAGVDHLRAEFNANAWSGRVEGGYRFVAPWTGGSASRPMPPGNSPRSSCRPMPKSRCRGARDICADLCGADVTDARSELGVRTDKLSRSRMASSPCAAASPGRMISIRTAAARLSRRCRLCSWSAAPRRRAMPRYLAPGRLQLVERLVRPRRVRGRVLRCQPFLCR